MRKISPTVHFTVLIPILYSFNTSWKSDSVNNESESGELYGV
jgi:hypothetical protein